MTINLFFAALPPPEARPVIAALGRRLQKAHGLRGALIDEGRLHVTLASAQAPQLSLQEAIWRAQTLAMEIRATPLPARFDVAGSFRGKDRYPFVLRGRGMTQLAGFRDYLRQAMQSAGFAVSSSYTPHITLLWADRCVEEEYPVAPICWQVSDFVLVMSVVGDSEHIQLGRWSLTSPLISSAR
jgi:2'-5' RNA ligase